jgi:phosphoglycerol transferase MdoB-like AlkP superfamily enzyme
MSVIITLIVYLIVLALVYWLVSLLPLPAPFGLIVRVLFVLLAILVVLSAFGIVDGGPPRVRLR